MFAVDMEQLCVLTPFGPIHEVVKVRFFTEMDDIFDKFIE